MRITITTLLLLSCLFFGQSLLAQEAPPLTDEEITKYAQLVHFGDTQKGQMQETYNSWITSSETLSPSRFKELKGAQDDEAALSALHASAAELEAYQQIQSDYDSMVAAFKETYTVRIKDKELLGVSLYNKMRKALKADDDVKARYEAILAALKEATPAEETDPQPE